ncbi:MAG TPA: TAT-variant-translocated molybdopterin oxidoreductase [Terriglobales bacterium]|nr:TAT-variant-translocated molybdopterin oxidoreductase [Terriglobales bacterium]
MPAADLVPLEALTTNGDRERYWRSLDERSGSVHDEHDEVPEQADEWPDESSRRRFLQLAGASLALAGVTGCTRQPTEFIYPYVDSPEHAIPGKPLFFATASLVNGIAEGVLVESHLGRPTKVEGNPDHPASLGSTCVHSQACVLDLYDPDRAREITHLGEPQTWEQFLQVLRMALPFARQGDGLRLLTETVISPTLGAQISALLKALPLAKWHQYDPCGRHSAHAGAHLAFGEPMNTYYKLDAADIVLALDADFLTCGPGSTRYARDFAARRRRGDRLDMNRLYSVESSMTSTGGKADHRLPLRYSEIERFARELATAIGAKGVTSPGSSAQAEWISALSQDLLAHRGASAIIPGEHQSPAVHALAHAMNTVLGNTGRTVMYTDALEVQPVDEIASLQELAHDMESGAVEFLLIFGGNPVYNAPADLGFAERLRKVKTAAHVGLHFNETSVLCHWHIPEPHFLEDWSDARAFDGTVTILQPLIEPLYDSYSFLRVLDAIVQFPGRQTYDIVRANWAGQHKGEDFEGWWRKSVHDGLIQGSALPIKRVALKEDWIKTLPPAPSLDGLELVFRPDPYLCDGRFANNTWLQELPRPVTKLTWDNAVYVSPATAKRLGLENQRVVELHFGGRSLEGPAWISPGHPDESMTAHLGYGRTRAGRAGDHAGFNAYQLRTSEAMWSGPGLEIRKTGKVYALASTQMQQSMEGRNLIIANTADGYRKDPDFVQHIQEPVPKDLSLYPAWNYTGYAWGMSIDLTACVGCNACVIACQAENNIPVVGKEQVLSRRAMHWLRIDTYYKGSADRPEVYYQPVPCMQCEDAPCELVCPVQATNHSRDGLNDMVYNRCVGTRYCSNNCPYKVRRFNFLRFQDWTTETLKLQRNPDVTVRSRGVMEKCTYCVQRIREGEIRSNLENRFIRDGEIQTACQQVCPTQAIVFGDINNRGNRVAKLKAEKLNYALLAELNTRPRTTYLAELRNPNPELKDRAT